MCGIVGVVGTPQASSETLQALMVLQHRGQDAAGLLSHDLASHRFHLHKQHGLIASIFDAEKMQKFNGTIAIGHNRYATVALKDDQNHRDLQPQFVNYPDGVAIAHNGNLPDAHKLKIDLAQDHRRVLISDNDVEVILNLVAQGLTENNVGDEFTRLSRAVNQTMEKAVGGYAVVGVWGGHGLFAFRDAHGIRPLVLGRKIHEQTISWMVASESSALLFTGYTPIRDIAPGELVYLKNNEEPQTVILKNEKTAHCFFEWIYFSSAESTIAQYGVHNVRLSLGAKLAEQANILKSEGRLDVDVVVPVPDTSRPAAIALAEKLKLPYRELLIKNRYIQRSFILPTQAQRENAVYRKLTPVRDGIQGKKILLVDDSIVRGTTSKRMISMLMEAGAHSVTLASTSPAITDPCYFGIDFPNKSELISAKLNPLELARELAADQVIFQNINDLREVLKNVKLCTGCLDGQYPMPIAEAGKRFNDERTQTREIYGQNI
ncbi:MAG: amidophosphoribosyltransferase [Bacteriovoracaceae bacterium]|nr:amidophosphoribosyltransferase [Bacteriovoracaceae bacterium]